LGNRGIYYTEEGREMLRIGLLVLAIALAFGAAYPASAETVYYCVPEEQRASAPDRLVSVEIVLRPDGAFASVVYKAANGAAYERAKQYEATSRQDGPEHYWSGTLRANRNVGIVGSLYNVDGRLVYHETIHDKLHAEKIVARVTSICDSGHPMVAESPPVQTPAAPAPSASLPAREINKFVDCVHAATAALAGISSEPAQTIVDAAIGECPKERLALESALARQGITKSADLVDGLAKEMRPNLLALVLNTRASVARPPGEPAKSEPAKGQPI
jgi:hypothetical protein